MAHARDFDLDSRSMLTAFIFILWHFVFDIFLLSCNFFRPSPFVLRGFDAGSIEYCFYGIVDLLVDKRNNGKSLEDRIF